MHNGIFKVEVCAQGTTLVISLSLSFPFFWVFGVLLKVISKLASFIPIPFHIGRLEAPWRVFIIPTLLGLLNSFELSFSSVVG